METLNAKNTGSTDSNFQAPLSSAVSSSEMINNQPTSQKFNSTLIWSLLAVLLVAVLGGGGYYFLSTQKSKTLEYPKTITEKINKKVVSPTPGEELNGTTIQVHTFADPARKGWKRLRNETIGFEVSYPEGWVDEEVLSGKSLYEYLFTLAQQEVKYEGKNDYEQLEEFGYKHIKYRAILHSQYLRDGRIQYLYTELSDDRKILPNAIRFSVWRDELSQIDQKNSAFDTAEMIYYYPPRKNIPILDRNDGTVIFTPQGTSTIYKIASDKYLRDESKAASPFKIPYSFLYYIPISDSKTLVLSFDANEKETLEKNTTLFDQIASSLEIIPAIPIPTSPSPYTGVIRLKKGETKTYVRPVFHMKFQYSSDLFIRESARFGQQLPVRLYVELVNGTKTLYFRLIQIDSGYGEWSTGGNIDETKECYNAKYKLALPQVKSYTIVGVTGKLIVDCYFGPGGKVDLALVKKDGIAVSFILFTPDFPYDPFPLQKKREIFEQILSTFTIL